MRSMSASRRELLRFSRWLVLLIGFVPFAGVASQSHSGPSIAPIVGAVTTSGPTPLFN